MVWFISERFPFWYENETNYTKYAQMYMWHVHFVKHKNKQSPFCDRLSDLYTLCMHKKSFICHESYNKCKLLFLYFLLFSSKFCTNMYACFNNTSRKFGGNMSSSFTFIMKRVKLDAIFWNSLRQSGPKVVGPPLSF